MTEHELRMQYLILEDNYRKLEQRISELEISLKLNKYLGLDEKVTNTSISLFLLRRDRERLSNDLGINVSDYASVKSFGEEALENLIYNCSDVLDVFKSLTGKEQDDNISESILETENDKAENVTESIIEKEHDDVETVKDSIKMDMSLDNEISKIEDTKEVSVASEKVKEAVVKKVTKRGRKPKAEKVSEKSNEEIVESSINEEKKEDKEIKSEINKDEPIEQFENLDDALNMWA